MEDEVYAYLQQHPGSQSVGVVAYDLQRGSGEVLNASFSLRNKGLIKMPWYPNAGQCLEII